MAKTAICRNSTDRCNMLILLNKKLAVLGRETLGNCRFWLV